MLRSIVEEANLTRGEARYLRALAGECAKSGRPVGPRRLSSVVTVSPPTALNMLRRLEEKDLVEYRPGEGAVLTDRGWEAVMELDWRHGVLETLLYRLGVSLEEACDAASSGELCIPARALAKVCEYLGHPPRCPHGDPIPHPPWAPGGDSR